MGGDIFFGEELKENATSTPMNGDGEWQFGNSFWEGKLGEKAAKLPTPALSVSLFIIFMLFMSIIIINLLVGLAVDDIQKFEENAELQTLSMKVYSKENLW